MALLRGPAILKSKTPTSARTHEGRHGKPLPQLRRCYVCKQGGGKQQKEGTALQRELETQAEPKQLLTPVRFRPYTLPWDVPSFYSQSLILVLVPPTIIPVKDCRHKGEHPRYTINLRSYEGLWPAARAPGRAPESGPCSMKVIWVSWGPNEPL